MFVGRERNTNSSCSPRAALFLTYLGLLCLTAMTACTSERQRIEPGTVRAFDVPVGELDAPIRPTHCLYSVPPGYTPEKPWPLVVALHGYGSSAAQFHGAWFSIADGVGYVLATPQGDQRTAEGVGWAWSAEGDQVIQRSIAGVRALVTIDPARIYLVGFSQGGQHAYSLGLQYPRLFRGLAALGAQFQREFLPRLEPPGGWDGLRVYIGHGQHDRSIASARDAARTLEKLGCAVHLEVYPDVGHGLPEPMAEEMDRILRYLTAAE